MENPNLNNIAVFEQKHIRRAEHNGEIWFSVVDIIEVLTDSPIPRNYWSDLKRRENQLHEICVQLKLTASDGRKRATDCANTEGVFRIIQSVPSPKAEPFKMWLAALGKQAMDETADPELMTERQAALYRAKGYPAEWISRRMQTIDIRNQLTDEWATRGVDESKEYGILTATIAKGTFGVTPSEHSQLKGLKKQNLRDHMTPLELIFTALSEELTRNTAIKQDAKGFAENHDAAVEGGRIAGNARRNVERDTGEAVVSKDNFLNLGKAETPKELPFEDKTASDIEPK